MICRKPDCHLAGVDQPSEAFDKNKRVCRKCRVKQSQAWYREHREHVLEMHRVIPNDDPEDDLVRQELGEGNWAKITRGCHA